MKYEVIGEGETVEVLGVLRQPKEVLSLLEHDAQPEVDRGVLRPIVEGEVITPEATVVPEAPAEGTTTPESEGAVVETANTETVETQPVAEVVPTAEATVATEPATGTETAQAEVVQ